MTESNTLDRLAWEAPMIQPHRLGEINKFGRRSGGEQSCAEIDGQPIDDLVERYGSPLFITSERRLRQNIRRIRSAFERVHPFGLRTGPSVRGAWLVL